MLRKWYFLTLLSLVLLLGLNCRAKAQSIPSDDLQRLLNLQEAILTNQLADGGVPVVGYKFEGQPVYINPYFSNLAILGLISSQNINSDSRIPPYIRKWLLWVAANQEANGTISDVSGTRSASGGILNPQDSSPDSHDSYAATMLSVAAGYIKVTSGSGLDQDIVTACEGFLNVLEQCRGDNHLYWNFIPGSGVSATQYLLDNIEVYQGLNDGVYFFNAIGDSTREEKSRVLRDDLFANMIKFWSASHQYFPGLYGDVTSGTPWGNQLWNVTSLATVSSLAFLKGVPTSTGTTLWRRLINTYGSDLQANFGTSTYNNEDPTIERVHYAGLKWATSGEQTTFSNQLRERADEFVARNALLPDPNHTGDVYPYVHRFGMMIQAIIAQADNGTLPEELPNVPLSAWLSVSVTSPALGSTVNSLPSIAGTASDNAGGNGINRVNVILYRYVSGALQSWKVVNGTGAWAAGTNLLPAAVSPSGGQNVNWSLSTNLPSGTNLPAGTYYVRAQAFDGANNTVVGSPNIFNVASSDSTNPTSAIVINPAHNSVKNNLTAITGTASDNAGGSGINRVNVILYRYVSGALQSWKVMNGTGAWAAGTNLLETTVTPSGSQNVNWSLSTNLPSGTDLPVGTYYVRAQALDGANNVGVGAPNTFNITSPDTTNPTSAVVINPVHNSTKSTLTAITGTATDNAGGSGINRVNVILYRYVSGALQSWRVVNGPGGTWAPGTNLLEATVSPSGSQNVNWSLNTNLPSGTDLPVGTYYVRIQALDTANNALLGPPNTFNIISPDITNPTSAVVINPAHNSTKSTLTTITGTATDNAGGSGINRVNVILYRYVSGTLQSWKVVNGTGTWAPGTNLLEAAINPSGNQNVNWSLNTNLPSGANLPAGSYYVRAQVFDGAGNALVGPPNTFNIGVLGSYQPTLSPIRVHSVVAMVFQQKINLLFSGTLSSATATKEENYAVTVAGNHVNIQQVTWDASLRTVTLTLEKGVLSSTEEIVVGWRNLKDADGKTLPEDYGVATVQ